MFWKREVDMRENKGKRIKIAIAIGGIACFAAAVLLTFFCYRVTPVTECMVLELGDKVSEDLYDYISGFDFAVKRSTLDLSEVRENKVGEYEAVLTHGWQRFKYTIVIEDTTAPTLVLKEEQVYLKAGEVYTADIFVEEAQDLSGSPKLTVKALQGGQETGKHICFEECGTYNVRVTAKDASGNSSSQSMEVIVDTAPEIYGVQEYYVAVGSSVDYLEGITAFDAVDGDVSESLKVHIQDLDITVAGDYEIQYTAMDDYGLVTEETWPVHVLEKQDLQEEINSHQISRHDQKIVGAYNLYDAGYYEEDNVAFIQEAMEPAVVVVLCATVSRGSGFILEITEDYVLVCTNYHVVKTADSVEICFHEGSKAEGKVVARNSELDIAFVEIDRDAINENLWDTLMTVHIDMSYWEQLENEETISLCFRTLNENGTVWKDMEGTMLEKESISAYKPEIIMTKMNMGVFAGSSGSAVFDGYGNLIAMVLGYEYDTDGWLWDWGVSLENIAHFYYSTYHRQMYYQ